MGLILGVFRAVPLWAWALAVVLAWGGWQKHKATTAAAETAKIQQMAADARAKELEASIAETSRRLKDQHEATLRADAALVKAKSTAASATAAADGLRTRLAAIQSSAAASDPAASGASQTGRLAELLGTCADRYRDVAAAADRAVIAGLACEAHYGALIK